MATQTQQDEAWNAVLDEMETWERLRHQPDCPRDVQIQLDDLLSQAPLIKAAPDLLAALKELTRAAIAAQAYVHTGCHTDERHNRVNNELITACKVAGSALAKAGE